MAAMTALLTQFSEAISSMWEFCLSISCRIASATSLSVFLISSTLYILSLPYTQHEAVGAFLLTGISTTIWSLRCGYYTIYLPAKKGVWHQFLPHSFGPSFCRALFLVWIRSQGHGDGLLF